MEKEIDIFIKTPFKSYVKASAIFDTEKKSIRIKDDKDANDKYVTLDLRLTIEEDVKSITKDIEEHKAIDPEKYSGYDPKDIELDNIKVENNYILCTYTVNAGDYRRLCVGNLSEIYLGFAYPPAYCGKVCW